jgi:plastocyanin
MRRGQLPAVLIACSALLFAAGCGSSGSSSSSSTAASTSTATGGLKTDTTPKYAAPASSSPVQSGTVPIAYRNISIDPDTVKVKVGSTLVWTDYDDITHNVTSQSGPAHFASANLKEGSKFSFKVTKAGVIHYECTYHPASMNGTIEVVK